MLIFIYFLTDPFCTLISQIWNLCCFLLTQSNSWISKSSIKQHSEAKNLKPNHKSTDTPEYSDIWQNLCGNKTEGLNINQLRGNKKKSSEPSESIGKSTTTCGDSEVNSSKSRQNKIEKEHFIQINNHTDPLDDSTTRSCNSTSQKESLIERAFARLTGVTEVPQRSESIVEAKIDEFR